MQQKITPNLWFDTEAEEAANFYVSVFKDARIVNVARYTEAGPRDAGMVMSVEFELDGQRFVGINGGRQFTFDEAVSFQITCAGQDEVDYYWERLTEGGSESQCGWCKDRFGLSWHRTRPDASDENARLVEAVYAALAEAGPADFHYRTYRLADGDTFVHIANHEGADNPLAALPAFAEFQRELAQRCVEPPAPSDATLVGAYA